MDLSQWIIHCVFSPTNIYSRVIKKFSDSGIRSCETRKKYLKKRLMRSKSPDGNKKMALYMDTVFSFLLYFSNRPSFWRQIQKSHPLKKKDYKYLYLLPLDFNRHFYCKIWKGNNSLRFSENLSEFLIRLEMKLISAASFDTLQWCLIILSLICLALEGNSIQRSMKPS